MGTTVIEVTDRKLCFSILIELLSLGAVAAYLHARGRLLGLFRVRPTWLGTGHGFGLLIISWISFYSVAWMTLIGSGNPQIFGGFRMVHLSSLATTLLMCLVNPFFEELIVVGCVTRALEQHGASVTVPASAFFRLAYHLYQGPIAVASILPAGLILGAYYWKKRDLWPLIVAHMFMDLLPMLLNR
jgi:membrane protease YdiL (CAAX protease family)